jgi:hypothetical protein
MFDVKKQKENILKKVFIKSFIDFIIDFLKRL